MVWRERRNHQRWLRGRVGADGGIVVAGDRDGDIGCSYHFPREDDGVALGFDYAHVEGSAGVEAQVVDKECGLERGRGGIGMAQGNEVCVAGCRTERDIAVFPHAGLAGYDGEHPREAGGVGGIGHGAHQESVGGMFGIDPQPQRYLLERVDVDGRGDDAIGYAQGIGAGVGRAVADGGGGALRCPVFRYAVDREVVEVEADGRNDGRGERVYTLCIVAAHGVAVAAEVEVVIAVGCKGQQGRIGGDADQVVVADLLGDLVAFGLRAAVAPDEAAAQGVAAADVCLVDLPEPVQGLHGLLGPLHDEHTRLDHLLHIEIAILDGNGNRAVSVFFIQLLAFFKIVTVNADDLDIAVFFGIFGDQLAECVVIDTVCGEGGDKCGSRAGENSFFHKFVWFRLVVSKCLGVGFRPFSFLYVSTKDELSFRKDIL